MSSSPAEMKALAIAAMEFSHSPYSHKKIGASVLLANGKNYSGCNIENASYGGTVCAERVAIFKAYSENKSDVRITEVFVASDETEPWPPCGFCLQVLSEFADTETKITLINLHSTIKQFKFKDLFPQAFKSEHLLKK